MEGGAVRVPLNGTDAKHRVHHLLAVHLPSTALLAGGTPVKTLYGNTHLEVADVAGSLTVAVKEHRVHALQNLLPVFPGLQLLRHPIPCGCQTIDLQSNAYAARREWGCGH